MDMLPFIAQTPPPDPDKIQDVDMVPKELDIFYKNEHAFLPEGKTFSDLTKKEAKKLKLQYRFSPFRPGIYQTLSGISQSGKSVP